MKWIASQMILPLQLSPQGIITAHAEHVLKGHCHVQNNQCCFNALVGPDHLKSLSYFNPSFYCTSRAICIGPGDFILCIFPQDQPIVKISSDDNLIGVPFGYGLDFTVKV